MPATLKRHAIAACLCALADAAVCAEGGLAYEGEMQAPRALRAMLEAHLDLYRWRGNERLDEIQLRRLVRVAPEQIRAFLEIEGFYAPKVETGLESAVLTLGKHLSSRAYLSYEHGLSGTDSLVKINYTLSKRLSVRAQAGSTTAVDLFYTLSFK
ncbi:MAG: translocation/assembly module TamB domain-containing protein [Burkholderiaceae bacterium]|nr:translocation/assembly module TamB domain-containing protein [Burkholderiaceae bacterium]